MGSGDFNKPAGTSTKANFMTEIRDMFAALAKMTGLQANLPDGCIRYNASTKRMEIYSSGPQTWAALDVTGENAGFLGGQNSAYHLARANHSGTQAIATLSDHSKANHDALGIDAASAAGKVPAAASGLATLTAASLLAQNAPAGFTIGGNAPWDVGKLSPASAGDHTITAGGTWTPAAGIYQIVAASTVNTLLLEIWDGSAWRGGSSPTNFVGMFWTDGSNGARIKNVGGTDVTVYYQLM